jgi:hypothetical protein
MQEQEMDEHLKLDCLNMFESWLTQIRSGAAMPPYLLNREFQGSLASLCRRLRDQSQDKPAASAPDPTDSPI